MVQYNKSLDINIEGLVDNYQINGLSMSVIADRPGQHWELGGFNTKINFTATDIVATYTSTFISPVYTSYLADPGVISTIVFLPLKAEVRFYKSSSSTALHLVDDPLPSNWQGTQHLRLCADSRKPSPRFLAKSDPSLDLSISLAEMFIVSDIIYWPPSQDSNPSNRDEAVDKLYRLLNPQSHLGNVKGTADERSIVYMTGPEEEQKAIIFISFDPETKLEGLKKWESEIKNISVDRQQSHITYVDEGEVERTVTVDKRSMNDVSTSTATAPSGFTLLNIGWDGEERSKKNIYSKTDWVWSERAMYRDINLGFYF